MKIILEKDTDFKALEAKINKHLANLEAEGKEIRDMKFTTDTFPAMRGGKVTEYKTIYSVMIVYSLPYEV